MIAISNHYRSTDPYQLGGKVSCQVSREHWDSENWHRWTTSTLSTQAYVAANLNHKVKLRIAACHGRLFGDAKLELQEKDFLTLEKNLGLHPSTLPILALRFGCFEQYTEFEAESSGQRRLKKLCMQFLLIFSNSCSHIT